MRDLLDQYEAWRAEGLDVGRAVVVRTFGSAPRETGSVLLVAEDGRMIGSVSGGCVEGATVEAVVEAQKSGRSRVIRYGISDEDAWEVGLACGGTIDVLVEPAVRPEILAAARADDRNGATILTELPEDGPAPTLDPARPVEPEPRALDEIRDEALLRGRSRTVETGDRSVFVEAFPARPRLVVVGATEVARSLMELARPLGYERVVVDARPAFATRERFPDVDELVDAWPDDAFAAIDLGPNDAVAILSHDPKFDEPAIVEAIRRGARYVGAIGSKKTQADRRRRLLEAGLTEADLGKLHGPIGLDLGGREPGETALAILAEIVAERRGGSGGKLHSRLAAPAEPVRDPVGAGA